MFLYLMGRAEGFFGRYFVWVTSLLVAVSVPVVTVTSVIMLCGGDQSGATLLLWGVGCYTIIGMPLVWMAFALFKFDKLLFGLVAIYGMIQQYFDYQQRRLPYGTHYQPSDAWTWIILLLFAVAGLRFLWLMYCHEERIREAEMVDLHDQSSELACESADGSS